MELLRKLKRRIGHRGAFLLFLALLDFLYGWSLIIAPITPKMHEVLPFDVWGFIWIAGGFACLVGAFMRMDRVSYGVAAMLKAGWAVAWVKIWWLNSDVIPRAWVSVAIWGAFSGLVVIVSTWPEDWRRRKVTTDLNLPESLDADNTREGGE
jgi:hypothetical protein